RVDKSEKVHFCQKAELVTCKGFERKFQDLSEALKENTKDVHEEAENTEFMKIFQKGQVSLHEFKLYLGSLYYIYVALEEESERNKDNPVYEPVYFPNELNRTAALEDDLEYFYGPTWKKDIQCQEETQKYVDRIHHVGQHEPELLVAHAYTRYLGDLSGGQILKKIAQKSLSLPNTGKGLSFFNFSGITNISKFKQLYRARMNSIPMDSSTIERIVEEARKSFLLNIEVFQELQKLANQGKPPQNNHLGKSELDFHTTGNNRTQTPKESSQAQMKHTDLLPSTPLLRWTLALFFLATTVVRISMSGFDDPGIFYSDNFSGDPFADEGQVRKSQLQKRFKDFLRQYRTGTDRTGFSFKYRDELKRHYNVGQYWIELEEAAKEVADEVTHPRPTGEETLQDIQSEQMSHLVKIPGIIIAATPVRAKATKITIQCRTCRNIIPNIALRPGLEGYSLPRKCSTEQTNLAKCPLDPYFIVPDKCKCVDFQTLKLQESPDAVPHGELPRHMQLYCDRYLCDKVVPGNRATIIGIYSIKKAGLTKIKSRNNVGVGIRSSYIRVVGIQVDTEGSGRSVSGSVTPQEEEEFRHLTSMPNIYDMISKSIAPSIYGSNDIKKAIACMLFGGSRKRLPDGLTRRGDINLLMMGDPGTAKSQLLKDAATRSFFVEGGAMVLADGGVVCIDEFDKMHEDDRVAIHEAMEQQTISIAKAGITTTLNSRCSVLAAANSVFGRWDETKGEENIDFMPTILSRFDMIFIVKDEHNEERDMTLAKHVMSLHVSALTQTQAVEGEIELHKLKKLIAYCRAKCGPRLSAEAAEKLKNRYILMRSGAREHERESDRRSNIPITVRQLEAVVRIAESLSKMKLQPFATEADIEEALRLFQVSTLDAALSGNLSGVEGFTTQEDQEMLSRIEKQLKRRFAIGSQVSEHSIIQDFVKQKYPEHAIYKVLQLMMRRGEIQHRMQRKVLYRIK
ncbi:hypothetical protein E2320_004113, partial [Naja naja]